MAEMFENVVCYIGRIFICSKNCPDAMATELQNYRGTVGLVGPYGETIGCWHTIEDAANKKQLQKMYIEYPNYPSPLRFEAQIKDGLISPDLDLFVAEPVKPLAEQTVHLSSALDVSLADTVHCFGYPLDQELVQGYKSVKRKNGERCSKNELQRKLRLPTIFTGRVCYNGWKQAVADYLCFPHCSGGIVVDDYGFLKGVHVAAFRVGHKLEYHGMRIVKGRHQQARCKTTCKNINLQSSLKKLQGKIQEFCAETSRCLRSCKNEVAAFVPIQIIEEPLELSRLHLIRWKQPYMKKAAAVSEQQPVARACLIKPARSSHFPDAQEDDTVQKSTQSRKKHKSYQDSSSNPMIWF